MASVIPFGQPIHIGHHSKKSDRAYRRRIANTMDRSCELQNKADMHRQKAAGLERQLASSIYSDDADAIEALQAKIEALEAQKARIKQINAVWRKAKGAPGWEVDQNLTEDEKAEIASNAKCWGRVYPMPYPPYKTTNLTGKIRAARQRIEAITVQQARQQRAESAGGVVIDGSGDWCRVTFAEKPDREVLVALKAAGFYWSSGSWSGPRAGLPAAVAEMQAV